MSLPTTFARFEDDLTRLSASAVRHDSRSPIGQPCLVARTKSLGGYPTAATRFYACEPMTILGVEVEGSSAVSFPSGSTLFALNLGASIPPQLTPVIITFVNHRWVFRYDG